MISLLPRADAALSINISSIGKAATSLGCNPAALEAIMAVETGFRSGFTNGLPIILYEAHIAFRQCNKFVAGLSVPKWDRTLYSRTTEGEYERLRRAIDAVGEDVALKSASWGLGQVLGVNHKLCGYETVQGLVEDMFASEERQLMAMVNFIMNAKIAPHVRTISSDPETCREFARRYNGSAYAQNAYHEKIAAAFKRISEDHDPSVIAVGDYGAMVTVVQRALRSKGYKITPDGSFGRMTRNAVEAFQDARGLPVTGVVDTKTQVALGIA